ncbi:hypothetical protein L1887_21082 [Cichorium endivia]|nr:hypothetical protein L1887_21082 [Cichorium endivia]
MNNIETLLWLKQAEAVSIRSDESRLHSINESSKSVSSLPPPLLQLCDRRSSSSKSVGWWVSFLKCTA